MKRFAKGLRLFTVVGQQLANNCVQISNLNDCLILSIFNVYLKKLPRNRRRSIQGVQKVGTYVPSS
jgi:hypothetical protein